MSKKINPNILRLGIKNDWESKYYQKKLEESKFLCFNNLELKKILNLFFKNYGLDLINCKLYYKKTCLYVFINYNFFLSKFKNLLFANNSNNLNYKKTILNSFKNCYKKNSIAFDLVKLKQKYCKKIINLKSARLKNLFFLLKYFFTKKLKNTKLFKNSVKQNIYLKTKLNHINLKNKFQRLYLFKFYKLIINKKKNFNQQNFLNLFIKKLFTILKNFLKNKTSIVLTLKQTHSFENILIKNKKELALNVLNLKKFQKTNYFESGIHLLFNSDKQQLAIAISNYVSSVLAKLKNPKYFNFFLNFLRNNLKTFLLIQNQITSIEIKIKGNLGRNPRAVTKIIIIGKKISNLQINNNLKFYYSTCFSKKGTFGIKTWVV